MYNFFFNIKRVLIIFFICVTLTSCSKIAIKAPDFITEIFPSIIQKLDEYFPFVSKIFPNSSSKNKNLDLDDLSELVESSKRYNIYPIYLQGGIRRFISEHCSDETQDICDEISSWEIPKGIFKFEPTKEDKIGYHLSCVAIIYTYDPETRKVLSRGTGFYFDKNKLITNYHVISDSRDIGVIQFHDYISFTKSKKISNIKATVLDWDQNNDLAILSSPENFSKCDFDIESPEVLSEVVTVGHPKGLFYTLSKGNINAYRDKDKQLVLNKDSLKIYSTHIDAPIYPGSSGGPLFYKGKVVGVNYSGFEDTTLNFSIHLNVAKKFIN